MRLMRPLLPIAAALSVIVIALVAWPAWGTGDAQAFETVVGMLGWTLGGLAVLLAVFHFKGLPSDAWAACAVLGAACLAGSWLVQFVETSDDSGLALGMVVALSAVLIGVTSTSRQTAQQA